VQQLTKRSFSVRRCLPQYFLDFQGEILDIHTRGMYIMLDFTAGTMGDLVGFEGYVYLMLFLRQALLPPGDSADMGWQMGNLDVSRRDRERSPGKGNIRDEMVGMVMSKLTVTTGEL
jgi:hypothetical protein